MIRELTAEQSPYAVELKDSQVIDNAYREGNRWFTGDGTPVANSTDIVSICIPARRM